MGPHFVLNICKEPGMTSYDVIRIIKRKLPNRKIKIGHLGTLDPFASGVLLVALGTANRLSQYIHEYLPKEYLASGKLGQKMDTGDLTGSISEERKVCTKDIKNDWQGEIENKMTGAYWQVPPAVSATKHKGKPLYKWAREGIHIKKEPVLRNIYELSSLNSDFPSIKFRTRVSSGTYIRTMFEDIATELGSIGHLTELHRSKIGEIESRNGISIEDLKMMSWEELVDTGISLNRALPLNKLVLSSEKSIWYENGRAVQLEDGAIESNDEGDVVADGLIWVSDANKNLLGLAQLDGSTVAPCVNIPSD